MRRGVSCSSIGPVSPASAGVVVALGGGITAGGEPQPATVARAVRAAAADHDVRGVWHVRCAPPRGGQAKAQIAAAAGVPPASITAETRSRDTIGNVWFTKPLLGGPAGQRVLVVTSDWHAARVRYLTRVIWGPGYRVAVEPVTGEAGTRPPEEIACWEAGLLAVARRWFAGIRPGDEAAIAAVLARDHPVYADHPQITLDELAAMIVGVTTVRHRHSYGKDSKEAPIGQLARPAADAGILGMVAMDTYTERSAARRSSKGSSA